MSTPCFLCVTNKEIAKNMPTLSRMKSFLRNIFAKQQNDRELDDEVGSYVESLAEEKIRNGMDPEEARRAARIELGGIEQVKEQVHDERIGNWLRSVFSDCRFGLRQLRKNPGFAAIAILALALGIGFSSIIF